MIFEETRAIQSYLQSDRAAKESTQISAINFSRCSNDVYMKMDYTGLYFPMQAFLCDSIQRFQREQRNNFDWTKKSSIVRLSIQSNWSSPYF